MNFSTILAPTDFSLISRNAINYAVEYAVKSNSKLVLFHVYQVPLVNAEVPISLISLEEMEQLALQEMFRIKHDIELKYGENVKIECKCKCGFAVEEINLFAKENKIDLIIMGMQGGGYMIERLMGSTTTSLIKKSTCPVLTIHQNVKFKNISKIVLASDFLEMDNNSILNTLKKLLKTFNAHLCILNVVPELETVNTIDSISETIKMKDSLKGFDYTFHKTENTDVIEGIDNFIFEQKADLIVMIPRIHSWFNTLFHESNTTRMVFHAQIPILALHE